MTTREMIEKLQQYPPDTRVVVTSDNFELNGAIIPASGVNECRGVFLNQTFRDSFDGTIYPKTVFVPKTGGKIALQII